MFTLHHVLHVRCQVSHVMCLVSCFMCHVSHIVMIFLSLFGGGLLWWVCYQRGLLRLVCHDLSQSWNGLIQVKEEKWTGFPKADRAAQRDFPRAKPQGYPEEQPCQPEENPVHFSSFTWIYILFKIWNSGDDSNFFQILKFEETLELLSFWNMSIVS